MDGSHELLMTRITQAKSCGDWERIGLLMDIELKAYLDSIAGNLTEQIIASREHAEALNQATRAEMMTQAQESRHYAEDLNRGTRVLLEDLRHQVQIVAEGVGVISDKIDRLRDDMDQKINALDARVTVLEVKRAK